MKKELKKMMKQAVAQGWKVEPTRNGHTKWIPADKSQDMVIAASTPSDFRSWKNLTAQLKRSGLRVK